MIQLQKIFRPAIKSQEAEAGTVHTIDNEKGYLVKYHYEAHTGTI